MYQFGYSVSVQIGMPLLSCYHSLHVKSDMLLLHVKSDNSANRQDSCQDQSWLLVNMIIAMLLSIGILPACSRTLSQFFPTPYCCFIMFLFLQTCLLHPSSYSQVAAFCHLTWFQSMMCQCSVNDIINNEAFLLSLYWGEPRGEMRTKDLVTTQEVICHR